MSKWRWVIHDGQRLFDVGILDDGSLHNPRGYPEDDVRVAIRDAEQRLHERRSKSAKKAAATCRQRTEKRVYDVARRIVAGHVFGPRPSCVICGKGLSDAQSIERGIGSECWQGVLEAIKRQCEAA